MLDGKPTVFLSCSAIYKVDVAYPFRDAIALLDMRPVILEDEPLRGPDWQPEDKLNFYLNKSDVFLALCTPDDMLSDGTIQTRQNVVDEIARARGKDHLSDRIAIFKEPTVKLHSNINPTYERLELNRLDLGINKFSAQLTAWGFKVPTNVAVPPGSMSSDLTTIPRPTPPTPPIGFAFTAMTLSRLLDTRTKGQTLAPGAPLNLAVAGIGSGVPASATAVLLSVTATNSRAPGYLSVFPAGRSRPVVSQLNFVGGETVSNLVETSVGVDGKVTIFSESATDVLVDIEGFFAIPSGSAGGAVALTPARLFDTRTTGRTLSSGSTAIVQVTGVGGVPTSGVSAVILNVTVTNADASGSLAVFPAGVTRPVGSNLSWVAGQMISTRVVVPVGASGQVSFSNLSSGSTDLVVDLSGYFTDSSASGRFFVHSGPSRVVDTRVQGGTLGPGGSSTYQVAGFAGVPTDANAVLFNVTVTNTTAASFLTVFSSNAARPLTFDMTWMAGQTVTNLVVATLSPSGAVSLFNSAGSTDVVIDLYGFF